MVWKIEIGSSVLYGIPDGHSQRDPHEWLIGSTPEAWVGYEHFLDDDGMLANTFSCYLLDTGTEKVMIDTAFGHNAHDDDSGFMPAALEFLGVSPSEIDHVVFTHLHPDHISGSLTVEQTPFFPNAVHWTIEREYAHWQAGEDDRSRRIAAMSNALKDAGVLNITAEPSQVISGVTRFPTYGHTPGHVAVRVSSGADEVVIAGDITFSPIQIEYTDWAFPFDVDKPLASEARAAFFDLMAESGTPYIAGHYADPGYGRVVVTADGRQYEALPVQELS
jgi:glyoxylase-like metal-dependent hydrolase (beta-lactamase superfamily II)